MNVDFNEEPSLRSFVNRKFSSFAKYTTLPLMEIILNELPINVAQLFMVNLKFDCGKEDVLDFCDSIQDVVQKYIGETNTQDAQQTPNEPLNRMEVFKYDPDDRDESDKPIFEDFAVATTSRGRGRGRGKGVSIGKIVKRGRPRKNLTSIPEEDMDTEAYDCLDQMSSSSRSSWSSRN